MNEKFRPSCEGYNGKVIAMTEQEAREMVVAAGKRLVETGLIARTWGNISCRISDSHFVITPSGRDYLSLTGDEIVRVAVSDCSYTGEIKPSSEKGIHAEVYKLHPDISFVIHTHQDYASALSVAGYASIKAPEKFPALGGEIICAAYGLPGTKKLRRGVRAALLSSKGKAVIMKHHGALCFGSSSEEAFDIAQQLEEACLEHISGLYQNPDGQKAFNSPEAACFAMSRLSGRKITPDSLNKVPFYESKRCSNGFYLYDQDKAYNIILSDNEISLPSDRKLLKAAEIHTAIYKNHPEINNIVHCRLPNTSAVSAAGIRLLPFLDDFAQIAGISVRSAEIDGMKISKRLNNSSAVLIHKNGALCCGISESDAAAVSMVVEKNCRALVCAALRDRIKPINPLEARLMRFVYLRKYSKQAHH